MAQRRMEGENELAAALALLEEVPVAGKAVSVDAGILKAAYAEAGSPLRALATLDPPVPVLHLYAQPDDPGYLSTLRRNWTRRCAWWGLLYHSRDDSIVPFSHMAVYHKRIPRAEPHELDGLGHTFAQGDRRPLIDGIRTLMRESR